MLKTIRTNTKTFIWIIVSFFILWCIGSAITFRSGREVAAKVFNKKISKQKFREFYEIVYFSPKYQALINSNQNLPERFLIDSALQYIALYQTAKKQGVRVSNEEVRDEIMRRFSSQGFFQKAIYERWVRDVYRGEVRKFEEGVRKELMIFKLLDSFKDEVTLSDEEVLEAIHLEKDSYKIEYMIFDKDNYSKGISFEEKDLENFYQNNQDIFRVPEKYDLRYLFLDPLRYASNVTINEDQIQSFYDRLTKTAPDSVTTPPFEEVRKTIENNLKLSEARKIAEEKAVDTKKLFNRQKISRAASKKLASKASKLASKQLPN